jgi:hypothetical protein
MIAAWRGAVQQLMVLRAGPDFANAFATERSLKRMLQDYIFTFVHNIVQKKENPSIAERGESRTLDEALVR